ncbi:PREDICTED: membrane cofactor protein [Chrysochloris asiatica]|uniref:Membrane cofactor protein n=1 Tax=Chrysochloris asiatica TaxID=185453 RepID=A0A9B0T707_CHRAS|nr:PREDICTED: membrane cofactor protein [Chrysochloris asiatica]
MNPGFEMGELVLQGSGSGGYLCFADSQVSECENDYSAVHIACLPPPASLYFLVLLCAVPAICDVTNYLHRTHEERPVQSVRAGLGEPRLGYAQSVLGARGRSYTAVSSVLQDAGCGPPGRYDSMKLKGTIQESYAVGATVEYECRLGYMLKPAAGTTTICKADKSWSVIEEACTRKSCPNPGEPKNGQVIHVNKTLEFGSQVEFACNEGYRLIGQKTIYCELLETNQVDWSNSNLPVCDVVKCIPPKDIQNGEYSNYGKEVYEYSEAVRYKCKAHAPDPYSLVGAEKLFCTTTGEWSSEPPQCKVVKCVFPIVENGDIIEGRASKFYYNAKVTFQCQEGFTMTGNRTTVCEETNLWTPPLPQCVRANTYVGEEGGYATKSGARRTTHRRLRRPKFLSVRKVPQSRRFQNLVPLNLPPSPRNLLFPPLPPPPSRVLPTGIARATLRAISLAWATQRPPAPDRFLEAWQVSWQSWCPVLL